MTHQKPIAACWPAADPVPYRLRQGLTASPSPDAGTSVPAAGTAVQVETVASDTISSTFSEKVTSDLDASVFVATSAKCTAVYVGGRHRPCRPSPLHAGPCQHTLLL